MRISFQSYANKTNFHMKSFALSLAFIMRLTATRKWPILARVYSGAPDGNFLLDPLKRYFRRSGVALKLYMFILGSAIIFLSVRSF